MNKIYMNDDPGTTTDGGADDHQTYGIPCND